MCAAPASLPVLPPVDATQCPLCGQRNGCAMEAARVSGQPPDACWCMTVEIPSTLRERVPHAARARACICARCASDAVIAPTR